MQIVPDCVTKNVTIILMAKKGMEARVTSKLRELSELNVYSDKKTGECVIANLNDIELMNCGREYSIEAQFLITGPEDLLEVSVDYLGDVIYRNVIPFGARLEDRTDLLLA